MTEPSPRLRRWVAGAFAPLQAEEVLRRLRTLRDPFGEPVTERVQAAVAFVAASTDVASSLAEAADLAERDWRDVLVAAGLADGDWPQRLDAALGLPSSDG